MIVFAVCVLLQERPELAILRRSAELAGVEISVLGIGGVYPANGQKLLLYMEHLKTLDPDQVVMGIDAYDVILSPAIHRYDCLLSTQRLHCT
jgi:hypothetical protein